MFIIAGLADDLNTPRVIAELHRLLAAARAAPADDDAADAPSKVLRASCRFIGIAVEEVDLAAASRAALTIDESRIEALIQERLDARAAKDFARSDAIRDELAAEGIALKDGKDPATGAAITTWEVKR